MKRQGYRVWAAVMGALALGLSTGGTVHADTVINGCTIVSNPTPQHHTVCPNATLPGDYLADADLQGANLANANLTGAILGFSQLNAFANLQGADLTHANLTDAHLPLVHLTNATLTGANLQGTDLHLATLTNVNLAGANLQGANLSYANLTNARVRDARPINATLRGANLTGALDLALVYWQNTICPDGTNSDADGYTCLGHLQAPGGPRP